MEADQGTMCMLKWGLVPSWARDPRIGSRMINARSETAAVKPSFRDAMRRRRCLIPADGFYEWKRDGDRKRPFCIVHRDRTLLAFAGIWELWRDPEGAPMETCAILTTRPTPFMSALHDRMPVIIKPGDARRWLETNEDDEDVIADLLEPDDAVDLEAWEVSSHVNRPANDDAACMAPAGQSA